MSNFHRPNIINKREFKAVHFQSPFVLVGNLASRRDDIMQVLLSLVYFLNGMEPFKYMNKQTIVSVKTNAQFNRICKGGAEELIPIFREVMKYGYATKPDY